MGDTDSLLCPGKKKKKTKSSRQKQLNENRIYKCKKRENSLYIYIYLKTNQKNVQKRYKNRQKLPCVSTLKNREMMQTKKTLVSVFLLLFHLSP